MTGLGAGGCQSPEEVERQADEEEGPLPGGWEKTVIMDLPPRKRGVHIRLDADVVDWFKSQDIRRG